MVTDKFQILQIAQELEHLSWDLNSMTLSNRASDLIEIAEGMDDDD